jgi:hypothetical protein
MATLVTGAQVLSYLGGFDNGEEGRDVALALADQIEALLLSQCARGNRPWQLAQVGRVERKDGTGNGTLYLDYPIAALTSVKLGYDAAAPIETLVVNDQTKLVWDVGSNRLQRSDSGVFGTAGFPGYVRVTYDTEADAPDDAALAVLRGVATVFGQRGSEDSKSERVGGFSTDLIAAIEGDPVWQMVVGAHRVIVL